MDKVAVFNELKRRGVFNDPEKAAIAHELMRRGVLPKSPDYLKANPSVQASGSAELASLGAAKPAPKKPAAKRTPVQPPVSDTVSLNASEPAPPVPVRARTTPSGSAGLASLGAKKPVKGETVSLKVTALRGNYSKEQMRKAATQLVAEQARAANLPQRGFLDPLAGGLTQMRAAGVEPNIVRGLAPGLEEYARGRGFGPGLAEMLIAAGEPENLITMALPAPGMALKAGRLALAAGMGAMAAPGVYEAAKQGDVGKALARGLPAALPLLPDAMGAGLSRAAESAKAKRLAQTQMLEEVNAPYRAQKRTAGENFDPAATRVLLDKHADPVTTKGPTNAVQEQVAGAGNERQVQPGQTGPEGVQGVQPGNEGAVGRVQGAARKGAKPKAEVVAPGLSLVKKAKGEKVGPDGFTETQREFLRKGLVNARADLPETVPPVFRESEYRTSRIGESAENIPGAVTIKVPDDGQFTVASQTQADNLLKSLGRDSIGRRRPPGERLIRLETLEQGLKSGTVTKTESEPAPAAPKPTTPAVTPAPATSYEMIRYEPSMDRRIKNTEILPRGVGAQFLVVVKGQGDDLIAKQYKRVQPEKLQPGEILIDLRHTRNPALLVKAVEPVRPAPTKTPEPPPFDPASVGRAHEWAMTTPRITAAENAARNIAALIEKGEKGIPASAHPGVPVQVAKEIAATIRKQVKPTPKRNTQRGAADLGLPRLTKADLVDMKRMASKLSQDIASAAGREELLNIARTRVPASLKSTSQSVSEMADKSVGRIKPKVRVTDLDDPLLAVDKATGRDQFTRRFLINPTDEARAFQHDANMGWDARLRNGPAGRLDRQAAEWTMQVGEEMMPLANVPPARQREVADAVRWFRSEYDNFREWFNTVAEQVGEDPLPMRQDYFAHMRERAQVWDRIFGDEDWGTQWETRSPTRIFNPHRLRRSGTTPTSLDAVDNMQRYFHIETDVLAYKAVIQRYDAYLRAMEARGLDASHSSYYNHLQQQRQRLANKLLPWDEATDKTMGTKFRPAVAFLSGRLGGNAVSANLRSALIQPTQLLLGSSKTGARNALTGIARALTGDPRAKMESEFLRNRYEEIRSLRETGVEKGHHLANWMMKHAEETSVTGLYWAMKKKAMTAGKTEADAILEAERFIRQIVGGRNKGQRPPAYADSMRRVLLQFTQEVNQFNKFVLHNAMYDELAGRKLTAAERAAMAGKIVGALTLTNVIAEAVTGRDVTIDPVETMLDVYDEITSRKHKPAEKAGRVVGRIAGEMLANVPLGGAIAFEALPENVRRGAFGKTEVSWMGGAPIVSIWRTIVDAAFNRNPDKARKAALSVLTPFGGAQIDKTYQGIRAAVNNGRVRDKRGKTQYRIKGPLDTAKGILFGPASTAAAKKKYGD